MSQSANTASSRSAGLELAVSASGTTLHVALRNHSDAPLKVYFAANALGRKLHDFLRAELSSAGGARRTLRFTGDRNGAEIGIHELRPGGEIADDLNLLAWARDPVNGGVALAKGDYSLTAVYDVRQQGVWNGTLSAGPIQIHVP